jgi:hypothetical protein
MYTIGVFQDVPWADRGIAALISDGFDPGSLSLLARSSEEALRLVRTHLEIDAETIELPRLGQIAAAGPLLSTLAGSDGALESAGLASACARAGFQSHDGQIFEKLVERGGVLVAVESVARAADALAKLHAFGGGNAAIGAWTGRL